MLPTSPAEPEGGAPPTVRKRRMGRNTLIAVVCGVTITGMVGAAYASVPLYKAFCNLTGYNGTVRRAKAAPTKVLAKTIQVRFDANVRELPWTFTPETPIQTIHIGEQGLAFFTVTNTGNKPLTGRAVYNVVPETAAPYFQKLECFCFSNQTLQPGQTMNFPVVYFVDPQFATDADTKDAGDVTLSYTFYPAAGTDKPQKEAVQTPPNAPQALGGTARAGL